MLNQKGLDVYAEKRIQRLQSSSANRLSAYLLDVAFAIALPTSVGVALSVASVMVLKNVPNAPTWISENIYNQQVTTALGTMVAFLVTMQLGANLSRNAFVIGHFGNLSGACVNMAIWSRYLTSGNLKYVKLHDENGDYVEMTEVGLILASVCYVVKYVNRGMEVRYRDLPIGASVELLERVEKLTKSTAGLTPVSNFTALVMLLAERFDIYESNNLIKPAELSLLFAQLNALTAEEGAITGAVSYSPPAILTLLLYVVFAVYYGLLIVSDLGPNNEWNSLWIVAALITANFGIFTVSGRYSNPFKIKTGNSTQRPLVSVTCRATERSIEGVFTRPRRDKSKLAVEWESMNGAWLKNARGSLA